MRGPSDSSQFHRDVKRLQKRRKDLERLKSVIELLLAGQTLPPQYKDHPLKLNWAGYRVHTSNRIGCWSTLRPPKEFTWSEPELTKNSLRTINANADGERGRNPIDPLF